MTSTTIKTKKPSKTTLKKALKLLQKSHDHIEIEGFDISSYINRKYRPSCFIGNVRYAAGIDPDPGSLGGSFPADRDSGPELTIALDYLDKAALRTKFGKEISQIYNFDNYHEGRIAEKIGLSYESHATKRYALGVFRSAIRSIVKDIES